jgi:predicted DNA-binding transcriptional regulator YafY
MTRTERAVRLLHFLQTRGRTTTVLAAAHLKTTRRQALSDLQCLATMAPIRRVGEGRDAEWLLDPLDGALNLGFLDGLALQVGRDATSFLEGTALAISLERATLAAPDVPPRYARNLDRKLRFKLEPKRRFAGLEEEFDTLLDGLLRERRLSFGYEGPRRTRRFEQFQPLTLVTFRQGVYLFGREGDAPLVRRLAVDRIRDCEVGEPFEYPADWRPDPELARWFGIDTQGGVDDVELRFDARVARYVLDRDWHATARFDRHPDGGVTLYMRTGGAELLSFVLEWGERVEVIRPARLRDEVQRVLRAALARYEGADGTGAPAAQENAPESQADDPLNPGLPGEAP